MNEVDCSESVTVNDGNKDCRGGELRERGIVSFTIVLGLNYLMRMRPNCCCCESLKRSLQMAVVARVGICSVAARWDRWTTLESRAIG